MILSFCPHLNISPETSCGGLCMLTRVTFVWYIQTVNEYLLLALCGGVLDGYYRLDSLDFIISRGSQSVVSHSLTGLTNVGAGIAEDCKERTNIHGKGRRRQSAGLGGIDRLG